MDKPTYEQLETEIVRLRQGYWDARKIMGFDNHGDETPAALASDIVKLMNRDAKDMRHDYDESIKEYSEVEAKLGAIYASEVIERQLRQLRYKGVWFTPCSKSTYDFIKSRDECETRELIVRPTRGDQ